MNKVRKRLSGRQLSWRKGGEPAPSDIAVDPPKGTGGIDSTALEVCAVTTTTEPSTGLLRVLKASVVA